MPEVESNRKRSRSPSDSAEQGTKAKRVNTGASSHDTDGNNNASTSDNADTNNNDDNDEVMAKPSSESPVNGADAVAQGLANATTSAEPSAASSSTGGPAPSAHIHLRCLIVTQDASIIIGKAGAHVNEIREKSGAKVMVSESIPGNPERILNVSGPLDAVSKVHLLLYFCLGATV